MARSAVLQYQIRMITAGPGTVMKLGEMHRSADKSSDESSKARKSYLQAKVCINTVHGLARQWVDQVKTKGKNHTLYTSCQERRGKLLPELLVQLSEGLSPQGYHLHYPLHGPRQHNPRNVLKGMTIL